MKPKTNHKFSKWRPFIVLTSLLLLIFVTACKKEPFPLPEKSGNKNPAAGELEVTVVSDSDEGNFIISIEDGEEKSVKANGKVTFNLNKGSYLVELKGLGAEYVVVGDNPVLVKIQPKKKTSIIFEVVKSPNNITTEQIVFRSNRTGFTEIFSMNTDGSDVRQLSNFESNDYVPYAPEISPDGSQILFDMNGRIFKMDIDDGDLHQVTFDDPQGWTNDSQASWSADGSKIAFVRILEGAEYIYIMNADGTNIQEISSEFMDVSTPHISPDGSKVLFATDTDSPEGANIYIVNSDGTNEELLISHHILNFNPKWSPDGTKILFNASITDVNPNYQLYLANADGTGIEQITFDAASKIDASWSPDGSRIVYATSGAGNIYSIKADGTDPIQLTDNTFNDNSPSWGPVASVAP